MNEQVFDLLGAALDTECIHLLTVRTCTLCKDKLFNRAYAKKYAAKPKSEPKSTAETQYCVLCYSKKPSSKSRATIRIPRTKHGIWEDRFGVRTEKGTICNPWCDHDKGICQTALPPTMAGPTVEVPKVHKATHFLPDGRAVCDECCFGHCKRCQTALPQGKPGTRVGGHRESPRGPGGPIATAAQLFG